MSTQANVPLADDYTEKVFAAGEADNLYGLTRIDTRLFAIAREEPAKFVRVTTDLGTTTIQAFPDDGTHYDITGLKYVDTTNRFYAFWRRAPLTIINPDTMGMSDVVNSFLDNEVNAGGHDCLDSDGTRLYALLRIDADYLIAGFLLSDMTATPTLINLGEISAGGSLRYWNGFLWMFNLSGSLPELWRINPSTGARTVIPFPLAASGLDRLIVASDRLVAAFEAVPQHLWTVSASLQVSEITTNQNGNHVSLDYDGRYLWDLLNTGVAVGVILQSGTIWSYRLSSGYLSEFASDGTYQYASNNQVGTVLSRYHILPPPGGRWAKNFGGTGQDVTYAVKADSNNNIITAGYFQSTANFGGSNLISAGAVDIFVAKYTPQGDHVWSVRFGGTGNDVAQALAITSDNHIIVGGYFSNAVTFGAFTLTSRGSTDGFLAKLNGSTGEVMWAKRFGGAGQDTLWISGIAIDPNDGSIVTTGQIQGDTDFDNIIDVYTTQATPDTFLAKYSPEGICQWVKTFNCGGFDAGRSVAIAPNSNIALVGSVYGQITFEQTHTSVDLDDIYIAVLNPSGIPIWSKSFGNTRNDRPAGVVFDSAGNVALTGFVNDGVNFGDGVLGVSAQNIFIAKFNGSTGAHMWSVAFAHSPAYQEGTAIAVDSSNHFYAVGIFQGANDFGNGYSFTSRGGNDAFAVKLNGATGATIWAKQFGGSGNDAAQAIAIDAQQNMIVVGSTFGGQFDGANLVSLGGQDMFIYKLYA